MIQPTQVTFPTRHLSYNDAASLLTLSFGGEDASAPIRPNTGQSKSVF
jgi:hypothetical protein